MVSDETFFAWLDGELAADEAARVELEVASDARLSAKAAEHRAMQARLTDVFDDLLHLPVPETLLAAMRIREQAEVIDFAQARQRREERRWPSVPQWGAMAATLAIGVLVGTLVPHQRETAPVQVNGGKIYAAASLDQALDTQLASAPRGDTRIGVTFRDQAGAICRSFSSAASSGLACRDAKGWQIRGLFAAPEGQTSDYRMAAGMNPNLAALVDSAIAGEPFDAAQEKSAKNKGWR
jgi:hypothetical protein